MPDDWDKITFMVVDGVDLPTVRIAATDSNAAEAGPDPTKFTGTCMASMRCSYGHGCVHVGGFFRAGRDGATRPLNSR
jgi:hypothetical protein